MISVKHIFPECDVDTLFVELLLQRGKPPHYKGLSKVGKQLIEHKSGHIVIGVADSDKFKREDPHLKLFTELKEDRLEAEGLIVHKLPNSNKYILRIHPEFEPWFWRLAMVAGIDGDQFGFKNRNSFEKAAKGYGIERSIEIKKFINAVISANPPAVQTMRKWLEMAGRQI
jgi:hypothetical protein